MRRYAMNAMMGLFAAVACGLAGCGGGGSSSPPSKVELKINLTGALPASTAIGGAQFTVTLPASVTTPANDPGSAVTPSGLFAGALAAVNYSAATNSTAGTMQIAVITVSSVTQVGEIATVTLNLANGAVPTAADFAITGVQVISSAGPNIAGIHAVVASATLK